MHLLGPCHKFLQVNLAIVVCIYLIEQLLDLFEPYSLIFAHNVERIHHENELVTVNPFIGVEIKHVENICSNN